MRRRASPGAAGVRATVAAKLQALAETYDLGLGSSNPFRLRAERLERGEAVEVRGWELPREFRQGLDSMGRYILDGDRLLNAPPPVSA